MGDTLGFRILTIALVCFTGTWVGMVTQFGLIAMGVLRLATPWPVLWAGLIIATWLLLVGIVVTLFEERP